MGRERREPVFDQLEYYTGSTRKNSRNSDIEQLNTQTAQMIQLG